MLREAASAQHAFQPGPRARSSGGQNWTPSCPRPDRRPERSWRRPLGRVLLEVLVLDDLLLDVVRVEGDVHRRAGVVVGDDAAVIGLAAERELPVPRLDLVGVEAVLPGVGDQPLVERLLALEGDAG